MARGSVTPQRALALAIVVLLGLALTPARYTRWAAWFRQPVRFVLAPISAPASLASRSLRPAQEANRSEDPALRQARQEREQFRTLFLQEQRENEMLRERIRELQSGLDLMPSTGLQLVMARVIGSANGVLLVRAGRDQGVLAGESVVVADGVHLVGRVMETAAETCNVLPVTDRRAGLLDATVFVDGPENAFACQLEPVGEGRMRGPVERAAAGIAAGQVVRLSDPDWPPTAQMLVLGRIESVASSEAQPLRKIITVTPELDLSRVLRVTVRIPEIDVEDGG